MSTCFEKEVKNTVSFIDECGLCASVDRSEYKKEALFAHKFGIHCGY